MDIKTAVTKGMLVATLSLGTSLALAEGENYVTWNGGVGIDNRAVAPTTGTKLIFLTDQGQFLADVHVTVKDSEDNTIVDTVSEGPWLIMNLPHGSYEVNAEFEGRSQSGTLTVDADTEQLPIMLGVPRES